MTERLCGRAMCIPSCPSRPHMHFSEMLGRVVVTGRTASWLRLRLARIWGVR